jgi:hypothetical protein
MFSQAAIQASKERSPAVMDKHYEWARDKMSLGAERRSAVIEDTKKLATAYHEGGHALAALYTKGAMPLYKVTCMPRGHALGVTYQAPVDDRSSITFTEYIASMDVAMGGRAAEELSKPLRDRSANLLIQFTRSLRERKYHVRRVFRSGKRDTDRSYYDKSTSSYPTRSLSDLDRVGVSRTKSGESSTGMKTLLC